MTPAPKAYSTTEVPVAKSQEEIRQLLMRFGAHEFTLGQGATWVGVEFVHDDMLVRLRCPLRPYTLEAAQAHRAATHGRLLEADQWPEAEGRRVWRVLVWSVKARLVAVEEGLESFAQAFLSHIVDPGTGKTLWQRVEGEVESGALKMSGGQRAVGPGGAT